nr:MAG TPA: hypothetical protein [Caudoviricetes sp.]
MYKYGKEVLKSEDVDIFNQYYTIYILDGGDYFDIHIVNDKYKDEEISTLWLEEPKECVTLEDLDKVYLYEEVIKFALRDKFYGYKDSYYTFDVTNTKEPSEV